jgi:GH24 family phage-related lysozyme (muramidase)/GNAT superfamily N-acetyltransferase
MKIHIIPADKKLLEGKDDSFVEYSDPSTFGWNYPVGLKMVNGLHFAADYCVSSDNAKYVQYGLFEDKKLTKPISAMTVFLYEGKDFGLDDVKEVPVVQMVVTKEEHRGKGYGKALYESVLNRHQLIISDKDLFTDEGKINKSLGMWVNHLTKLGDVVNIDYETKEISKFNLEEAKNRKDTRFMILKEGVLGKVGRFAAGALAAASLGTGSADAAVNTPEPQNFKTYYQSDNADSKIEKFRQMIIRHEGMSNTVYKDSTGHNSIGIGFNLERPDAAKILSALGKDYSAIMSGKDSLSDDEINKLFNMSVNEAVKSARKVFAGLDKMPAEAKFVALDLIFNIGEAGVSKFKNFIAAMNSSDWGTAADELMYKDGKTKAEYSDWWKQVTNNHGDFEEVKNKNPDNRAVELNYLIKKNVK